MKAFLVGNSADDDAETNQLFMNAGADYVLSKPTSY